MRKFSHQINIATSPDRAWRVLCELGRWSEWTSTIQSIEQLDAGPPGVGTHFRICQPKLRPAVWQVTAWEPIRRFTWILTKPGLLVSGDHIINPTASGCVLALDLRFSGFLGSLAGYLTASLNNQYLSLEAEGFKKRCENDRYALSPSVPA